MVNDPDRDCRTDRLTKFYDLDRFLSATVKGDGHGRDCPLSNILGREDGPQSGAVHCKSLTSFLCSFLSPLGKLEKLLERLNIERGEKMNRTKLAERDKNELKGEPI